MSKSFKFIFVFCFSASFTAAFPIHENVSTPTSWTEEIFSLNPSNEEINLILNLLYFSWMRSKVTIETQEIFTDYLEEVLMVGYDITNRRINPSRKQKYPDAQNNLIQLNDQFHQQLGSYEQFSTTYAQCLNSILDDHMLSNKVEQHVLKLRNNLRDLIIGEVTRTAGFKSAHHMLKILMKRGIKRISGKRSTGITRGAISEYFWELFPPFAVASFVEFDKKYNWIHRQWGDLMITGSRLSNTLWALIEETRAQLYKSYYQAFYKEAKRRKSEDWLFAESFDETGFIETEKIRGTLPSPVKWHFQR